MVKIPAADALRAFPRTLGKATVEDLSLIAQHAKRSKITEAEARSLDMGKKMLDRGFAALVEILRLYRMLKRLTQRTGLCRMSCLAHT